MIHKFYRPVGRKSIPKTIESSLDTLLQIPKNMGMFWLLRKLFFLGVLGALFWVILQLDYQGRPVKDHVREFLNAPLIQEIVRQVRGEVDSYLKKRNLPTGPAMENIDEKEKEKLEEVLEKEGLDKNGQ